MATFNITIEKIAFGGYGLGYYLNKPVFVPHTLPGAMVECQQTGTKNGVLFGKVVRQIQPSLLEVTPKCPVFGDCGGCDWLNLPYKKQLEFKQQMVNEKFAKLANEDTEFLPIKESPLPQQYRNKSFMPVQIVNKKPEFGIYQRYSHNVVPHQSCMLHPPVFEQAAQLVLDWANTAGVSFYDEETGHGALRHVGGRYSFADKSFVLTVVSRNAKLPFTRQLAVVAQQHIPNLAGVVVNINAQAGNRLLGDKDKIIAGQPYIMQKLGGLNFRVHYASFFQVNTGLSDIMFKFAKGLIPEGSNVIDAYAGAGTIGLLMSDKAKQVKLIESFAPAVEDGKYNAQLNGIDNCDFVCGKAEDILPNTNQTNTTVVFDPPRKGLDKDVITTLTAERVVYISCNPATQARDVALLIKHGYKLKLVKPFDMFPQTWHLENLVLLER